MGTILSCVEIPVRRRRRKVKIADVEGVMTQSKNFSDTSHLSQTRQTPSPPAPNQTSNAYFKITELPNFIMEDSKPQMNGSLLSTEKQDILVAPAQEPIASPGPGTSDLENPTTSSFATSTLSTDTKNSSTATFAPEPLIEHSTAGTSKTIPEAPIPENTTTQATPSAENIESIAPPASQPSTTVMSAEKAPAAETVAKPVESNGAPKETKQQAPKSKDQKQNAPATTDGAASSEKLSPAELKRRAKAEKAARRAAAKESSANTIANTGHQTATPGKKGGQKEQGNTGEGAGKHKRSNSTSGTKQAPVKPAGNPPAEVLKKDEFSDKDVTIFSHLYNQGRRDTIAGANKDVHPAVLTLGLQIRDYVICGSNARCVATLLAFKRVSCIFGLVPNSL